MAQRGCGVVVWSDAYSRCRTPLWPKQEVPDLPDGWLRPPCVAPILCRTSFPGRSHSLTVPSLIRDPSATSGTFPFSIPNDPP